MKVKPPPGRRKSAGRWDEIEYLYGKLLYWLYQAEDRSKARRYAGRLAPLLRKASPEHDAILAEECWSLVYEARGDLPKAITHRENETRLIRTLHEACRNTAVRDVALQGYDYDDLSDRLDLLAVLYHDNGDLGRAIAVLEQSKQLCEAHGIAFDGEDLLKEYTQENAARLGENLAHSVATRRAR